MIHGKIFFIFICRPQAQAQTLLDYRHRHQENREPTVRGSNPSGKAPRFYIQGTGDIVLDVYNAQAQRSQDHGSGATPLDVGSGLLCCVLLLSILV